MSRKWFRRVLPSHESIVHNRWLAWMGPALRQPQLWQLHRRNVSRAVAIGLFCGLMPGPTQMLSAGILAWLFRVNLPVALFTTLYTNPFTIVPLYLLALKYGELITGYHGAGMTEPPEPDGAGLVAWAHALGDCAWSLGPSLLVGLVALALTLALAGYVLVEGVWRMHVVHAWRKRKWRHGSDRKPD